ncbi:hypothetical protein BLNAU_4189 [Blattamonas nauphoetae]|uniref:Uncharacterized protein n=1 Tax=Blattamonas nauphoetae TaxID=2049346 RepID=A0ABQ9YAJ5_9EUKA|nr:hypothetical protein BLNAU_4189 [Blattamonas nauphoetae]
MVATGELPLDRAPSLTHPRLLASPIPGIVQRKQVNSCSIVPPPSLIPDCWRRRSLASCCANSFLAPRIFSMFHISMKIDGKDVEEVGDNEKGDGEEENGVAGDEEGNE